MKEFYYNRKKLRNWTILSLILLLGVLCLSANTFVVSVWLYVVKIFALLFYLGMFYVYINPQRLAKIDDEGIIIDSNEKLKWADIEKAERFKKKFFCGRDFIRFKLKKNAKYHLRFMQKLSATIKYGAFSVPLYAMTKKDAAAIEKEIYKHLTVGSKIKNTVKRVLKTFSSSKSKTKSKKK